MLPPLSSSFYRHDTVSVARALLGHLLCRESAAGLTAGIIVETEAYLSRDDPACHASCGRTRRNAPMFGPPGQAYIYFIYGNHFCFNVVTAPAGIGEAVLIRALEPVDGLELMQRRRGQGRSVLELTNGPGKLCQALAIDQTLNEHDLCRPPLWISAGREVEKEAVISVPRIGISRAVDKLLRFYIKENKYVSRRKSQR
ncbi:MAG: DNA-3-methyladenine glycosylase [Dethiobacteria bacterium]|nr:DNA-3-methyladenine glycosylase [Bacillota bacterium]